MTFKCFNFHEVLFFMGQLETITGENSIKSRYKMTGNLMDDE